MASIFFKGLKMKDLAPEQPAIANFLTGEARGPSLRLVGPPAPHRTHASLAPPR